LFVTGQEVTIDIAAEVIVNHTLDRTFSLKPLGEVGPVIDAGGLFDYARQTGMIAAR
jgi:3-isopropylmalate/(R)-2-methylmalate dehydratase small subunit